MLGKQSMRSMQELTLRYYDEKENWRAAGRWADEEAYARWREMTEGEIKGRWGPVSYMIAIVMRRQAGSTSGWRRSDGCQWTGEPAS